MTPGQLTLPDTSRMEAQRPRDLLAEAVAWADTNYYAWVWLVHAARRDAANCGRVRVKHYVEELRFSPDVQRGTGSPVKLPNSYSAAFTRILAAWYPDLAPFIPKAHSKLDGAVVPPAPTWARQL